MPLFFPPITSVSEPPLPTLYLLPTFTNAEQKLFFQFSQDLKSFTPSISPIDSDPTDGIRDPTMILRGGVYYYAYTAGNFGNVAYVRIRKSPTLMPGSFSAQAQISTA